MLHGDAVHEAGEAQGDVGHVHQALMAAAEALDGRRGLGPEDARGLLHGEAVVAGRNRGVGGEDALLPHRLVVALLRLGERPAAQLLLEQGHGQQRGVPLVQVVDVDLVAQRLQHAQAADAEHDLLGEAVVGVSAIEMVGEHAVGRIVDLEVGVEQVDGDDVPGDALHVVAPGAQMHRPAFDRDRDARALLGQALLRLPALRLLGLVAVPVQRLAEVALAVHQRDRSERQRGVGGRAHRVAGQNAEAAAVGGHRGLDGDLHREVADVALACRGMQCGQVCRSQTSIH